MSHRPLYDWIKAFQPYAPSSSEDGGRESYAARAARNRQKPPAPRWTVVSLNERPLYDWIKAFNTGPDAEDR